MWLGFEEREVVQGRYISPKCLGRRNAGTRAHPETLKWQWAANQILPRKHTLNFIHTQAFCHGKMGGKTFFNGLDVEQSPLVPLQHSSWARFYFKSMCNLSKANRISCVFRVKHRLKIAFLARTGCLPCRPSLLPSQLLGVYSTGCWAHHLGGMTESRAKPQFQEKSRDINF